jgi:hypothetical protein
VYRLESWSGSDFTSHVGDHYYLATELLKKGDLEGAIAEYRTDLRLNLNQLCSTPPHPSSFQPTPAKVGFFP